MVCGAMRAVLVLYKKTPRIGASFFVCQKISFISFMDSMFTTKHITPKTVVP